MADTVLPYGLRDVKITPLGFDETPGTPIDLPNAQTFTFSEAEEFEELRGDDRVVAKRGRGASVSWDLESGGISLEAYAAIAGGTLVTTGTAPDEEIRFVKKSRDARPYFRVEGQAISDSGGDFHTIVRKCQADGDLGGEMADGTFWLSAASGTGFPLLNDGVDEDILYEFVVNATAVSIPVTAP